MRVEPRAQVGAAGQVGRPHPRLERDGAARPGPRKARDTPGPPVKVRRARIGGHRLLGAPGSGPSATDRPSPGAELCRVSTELQSLDWMGREEDLKPPLPRKSRRKKRGRDSSHRNPLGFFEGTSDQRQELTVTR